MIDPQDDEEIQALRGIAQEISEYRQECVDRMYNEIITECDEVVDSGYDLARGSGRGPWWADGD
jgi:hypothetical protein